MRTKTNKFTKKLRKNIFQTAYKADFHKILLLQDFSRYLFRFANHIWTCLLLINNQINLFVPFEFGLLVF